MNLTLVTKQLQQERSKVQGELNKLDAAIKALNGSHSNGSSRRHRVISAAGRERIAAAQRARWAKVKAKQKRTA